MPLIAYDFLQSRPASRGRDGSFDRNCVSGIKANREKMRENLERSLMLVTRLTPVIGYDHAAKIAHEAQEKGQTLREAALASGLLGAAELDALLDPEKMV
jgi:fumarate hydratase class II